MTNVPRVNIPPVHIPTPSGLNGASTNGTSATGTLRSPIFLQKISPLEMIRRGVYKFPVRGSIVLLRLWQRAVSPLIGKHCKFHPTCSEYACQALKKHGFLRGCGLTVKRVCSCNPWHAGGDDPVP